MNARATILGCGVVDAHGIAGTRGVDTTWAALGCEPPGTGRTMKAVFDKADPTFRRLDLPGRALVLACEAAGVEQLLGADERAGTAVVVETDVGSLVTDLAFAASLHDEVVHAGIFPYSLTSTCLGEVALRQGLRGTTVSMSVRGAGSGSGEALREALRMLHAGEAEHVLAGSVDALGTPACGRAPVLRAVVAVLARPEAARDAGLGTLSWSDTADDPFAAFVARCR